MSARRKSGERWLREQLATLTEPPAKAEPPKARTRLVFHLRDRDVGGRIEIDTAESVDVWTNEFKDASWGSGATIRDITGRIVHLPSLHDAVWVEMIPLTEAGS